MAASGNDFVVIDNRQRVIANPVSFARKVCERHSGVGGDGVLLIENVGTPLRGHPSRRRPHRAAPTDRLDYRVRIFNPDGSEAEACGNGFRCIAFLAHQRFGFGKRQRFESLGGVIDAEVKGNRVRVRLTEPEDFKQNGTIQVGGRSLGYQFIRVGVPHVVIFVEGLSEIPVLEIGREIRYHPQFKPAGTNVNFAEVTGPRSLAVETYERGVERVTLACGTGSTASAVVSAKQGYVEPPVQVKTRGGEILTVDFKKEGEKVQDVYLEGEAKLVFEGKLNLE